MVLHTSENPNFGCLKLMGEANVSLWREVQKWVDGAGGGGGGLEGQAEEPAPSTTSSRVGRTTNEPVALFKFEVRQANQVESTRDETETEAPSERAPPARFNGTRTGCFVGWLLGWSVGRHSMRKR